MVLEDAEEAVEPDVDRRGLQHRGIPRLHHDPPGVDLGQDVAVAQQHAPQATRPRPSYQQVALRPSRIPRSGTMPVVSAPVFHRYVALGDSFTEGVGDPDPARPNGVRGWADRVAEVLATRTDDFGYANLAIRGRTLRPILAEQIEPALALRPDLVTIYAGGNDLIRPRIDIDALGEVYDDAIARLRRDGRHGRAVHGVRPGRRWAVRPAARPVRGLQRARPRDRRPARRGRPRLLADAARAPRDWCGPRTGCTSARSATRRWRSRCSTPWASRTTSALPTRPRSSATRRSSRAAGPTSPGSQATPLRGCTAASPGGRPATAWSRKRPALEPI